MRDARSVTFPPYRLDLGARLLWRDDDTVHLTPKAWDVLCYLVAHSGQVVTKNELFDELWPDTIVTERALTKAIGQVRVALGDDAGNPRFIQTVHRRGFRFIAATTITDGDTALPEPAADGADEPIFVGREKELAEIESWLSLARSGRRQLGFVTGDAGLGKTSLIQSVLRRITTTNDAATTWIARGQCIQQHGAGEAYMPVLEALGSLSRGPLGPRLAEVLRQYAPTWLVQLPGLGEVGEAEDMRQLLAGTGKGRMLREIADALEVLTADRTLVLVLEDLHWSDGATLDFLAALSHRSATARLLVLGLYRPIDIILSDHPLRELVRTLRQRHQGKELHLESLRQDDVEEYCAIRFNDRDFAASLAAPLHARTEGNPLFLVAIIEHLLTCGWLTEVGGRWRLERETESIDEVPDSLRQMIESRIGSLSDEDLLLMEGASVAGVEFALPAVAACIAENDEAACERLEIRCERLMRDWRLLRRAEARTWPDGTEATYYEFAHALYRQVLYERIPGTRRRRLHQKIGERLEAGYGERTQEIAAELAAHFQSSSDHARAVTYLWQAAAGAGRRFVTREVYLAPAVRQLGFLPESPTRDYQELLLRMNLGMGRFVHEGFAGQGVEENIARAEQLCAKIGDDPQMATAFGTWFYRFFAGHHGAARAQADALLRRGCDSNQPMVRLSARFAAGTMALFEGDQRAARSHFDAVSADVLGESAEVPPQAGAPLGFGGAGMAVYFHLFESLNHWHLGFADRARSSLARATELADASSVPIALCGIACLGGIAHLFLRDPEAVELYAARLGDLSRDYDYLLFHTAAESLAGWAESQLGDPVAGARRIAEIIRGEATEPIALGSTHSLALSMAADAHMASDQLDEGMTVVEKALHPAPDQLHGHLDAELHRQAGELALRIAVRSNAPSHDAARAHFEQAMVIARRQEAKILELRAAMSMSRLLCDEGHREQARELLGPIHGWFTEGFDSVDLREARALLETMR